MKPVSLLALVLLGPLLSSPLLSSDLPGSMSILSVTTGMLGGGGQGGSGAASSAAPGSGGFLVGFNQGWMHDNYGSQWLDHWDPKEARRLLTACRQVGTPVLRIWLFEGALMEGVLWDGVQKVSAPAGERRKPTGLDLTKLANIEEFLGMAREEKVQVYLTLFDANITEQPAASVPARRSEWQRILNDRDGAGASFLESVLTPLLRVVEENRPTVYAIDLANEINAFVKHDWFDGGWEGAVRFTRSWREAVRRVTSVPVTVSLGHHDAVENMLAGRVPAGAVDFFDFHVYDDAGKIPEAERVKTFASNCGKPVLLGEFGQSSTTIDDALQERSTELFLKNARDCSLSGALAWRLLDSRTGGSQESRFSFQRDGRWRPAARKLAQPSR